MYVIELAPRAARFLERLEVAVASRVRRRLKRLSRDPVPSDARFIGRDAGEKMFRIRIGDWRVLYTIDQTARVVMIQKIDKRSRVYSR